jgi:pimeloyl-ACP methyl ester carboxylesterase
MRPFYFGAVDRPLFGVYGAPVAGAALRSAVGLCYPFGQEYLRSHRALRELCHQLGQRGHHTLRFDYSGCGDSSGSSRDCTVERWLEDIQAAVTELRESAGTNRVALLGLRLGGTLAALAGSCGLRLDRLVLWDPVVGGREYLEDLARSHREFMQGRPRPAHWQERDPPDEVLGTALPPALRAGISALDLLALEHPPASTVLIVSTQKGPGLPALREHLERLGARVDHQQVDSPPLWRTQDGMDRALVPQNVIQAVASWLEGRSS